MVTQLTKISAIHPEIHGWLAHVVSTSQWPVDVCLDFCGEQHRYSNLINAGPNPALTVRIHNPGVVRRLIEESDPLVMVDALLNQQWSFTGAVDDAVSLYCCLASSEFKPTANLMEWCHTLPTQVSEQERQSAWTMLPAHSPDRDKAVVQSHYDLGNEFYRLWLDDLMVYSCAHFEEPDMTLASAQEAKLDLICRKLRLEPGEKFLDVGCGWGALLRWAATHYGVVAQGITLSEEQLAFNRKWIADEGLGDQITVELLDYRDLPPVPTYDKIASIGMVEHVGLRNYGVYFQSILSALKPGGLFLNHGIVVNELFQPEAKFIDRYIFPDGQCSQLTTYLRAAHAAGWEIVDVDSWRQHYAKTLRCWAANLEAAQNQAIALVGERCKLWQLYLTVCAQGFEYGRHGIFQTLLRRAEDKHWNLPLVRKHWLC